MILKAYFTDEEIESFFRKNGYMIIPHKRGKWQSTYHNKNEYIEIDIPGVVIPERNGHNRVLDGLNLFERVAEKRIKGLIMGSDKSAADLIKEALINI